MADMPILDDALPETRLAAVQDAILALRQGKAVTVGGAAPLDVLAAETMRHLPEGAFAGPDVCVVLSACRAAAVLGRPVAGVTALRPAGWTLDIAAPARPGRSNPAPARRAVRDRAAAAGRRRRRRAGQAGAAAAGPAGDARPPDGGGCSRRT